MKSVYVVLCHPIYSSYILYFIFHPHVWGSRAVRVVELIDYCGDNGMELTV